MLTTILSSKDIKTQLALTRVVTEYTSGALSEVSIQTLRDRIASYEDTYSKVNFINLINIPVMNILFPILKYKYSQALMDPYNPKLEEELTLFRVVYGGIFGNVNNSMPANLFIDLAKCAYLQSTGDFSNEGVREEMETTLRGLLAYADGFEEVLNLKLSLYLFVMNTIVSSILITLSPDFINLLNEITNEVERLQSRVDVFHVSEVHTSFLNS